MNLGPLEGRLLTLFDDGGAFALAVLVAAAAGALHALAPGHGKTLTAAYLVGQRGRTRDAVVLGIVVAGMHTASVAVLAAGWYLLVDVVAVELERVTAILQLLAALLAIALGLGMLARQRRPATHHHGVHHRPDGDVRPWSGCGLAALGLSGGLVPSPSAFLVLVSGLLAGRLWVAAALVAAFALGMAVTLAAVGLLALRGRDLLAVLAAGRPRVQRAARALPAVAALGVLAGGTLLAVHAAGLLAGG